MSSYKDLFVGTTVWSSDSTAIKNYSNLQINLMDNCQTDL